MFKTGYSIGGNGLKVKLFLLFWLFSWGNSVSATEAVYENLQKFQMDFHGKPTFYYFFPRPVSQNEESRQLVIFLDGRGKQSVLGLQKKSNWETISVSHFLNMYLPKGCDLLVPERIYLEMGQTYLTNDAVSEDHFKNKLAAYSTLIDNFLNDHPNYEKVSVIGYSEGGILLPKLYHQLTTRSRIHALVLWASGGFSLYEDLKLQQQDNAPFPEKYREALDELETISMDIRKTPFRSDKTYFGWPYMKWAYFLSYKPLEDLVNITIPILILHGEKDLNIPVESSRAITDMFQEKEKSNYLYREYKNANHVFNGQYEQVIKDINLWLEKN